MNLEHVAAIAKAVLYEGYILYPYRATALKNQQRWSFGAVFPQSYAKPAGESWTAQTECLVRGDGNTKIEGRLRFLHLVRRDVDARSAADALPVPWDEAAEREVPLPAQRLDALVETGARLPIGIEASRDVETVCGEDGAVVGSVTRTAAALAGIVDISAEPAASGVYRLRVRIGNTTATEPGGMTREEAQRWAFASTHVVLGVSGGGFVSLTDPPDALREAAAACDNRGLWPVLVGGEGRTDTLLASPIILPDYPEVAPESPGDLFDGCEIDEILTLRILTMTDSEKREMAALDPKARALLERTEALTPAQMEALHGTLRRPGGTKPRLASLALGGRRVSVGDVVRLRPKGTADAMDIVLAGMLATIEGIERDFEDRVHLAVTIVDDPGRDFGSDRFPGHRFFFGADEVEPVGEAVA